MSTQFGSATSNAASPSWVPLVPADLALGLLLALCLVIRRGCGGGVAPRPRVGRWQAIQHCSRSWQAVQEAIRDRAGGNIAMDDDDDDRKGKESK